MKCEYCFQEVLDEQMSWHAVHDCPMLTEKLDFMILEGKTVRRARTLDEWARWMANQDARRVRNDIVHSGRYGEIQLSTIFLGIMHLNGELFETMVFREKNVDRFGMPAPDDLLSTFFWGEGRRYRTYVEAEMGHAELLAELVGLLGREGPD